MPLEAQSQMGKAVVAVTYDASIAKRMDRVVVLKYGKVVLWKKVDKDWDIVYFNGEMKS